MKNIYYIIPIIISSFIITTLSAQTLEERIRILEEKVRKLESYHGIQTPSRTTTTQPTPSKRQSTTQASSVGKTVSTKTESMSTIIRTRLFKKNLEATAAGKSITMLIAFTNASRESISRFRGTIVMSDNIGNELVSFSISFAKPIGSLDSESWFGEIPYKPNEPGYKELLSLKAEDIKTRLDCEEVVFADGSVKRAK